MLDLLALVSAFMCFQKLSSSSRAFNILEASWADKTILRVKAESSFVVSLCAKLTICVEL